MTLPHSPTLADQLAAARKTGYPQLQSACMLFPAQPLPTWESLKLDRSIKVLYVALFLNLVAIYCAWRYLVSDVALPLPEPKYFFLALVINFVLLIGVACSIQAQLHQAGLQKYGWIPLLVLGLILNPLVLGWVVPVLVLCNAAAARRQLIKVAP
jgi:CDP-diglyceride synthetase